MNLALTPGEPAGIGPDLCVMLAQQPLAAQLVVIADPALLQRRASLLGLPLNLIPADTATDSPPQQPYLRVLAVELAEPEVCGQLNRANASYVLECLRVAAAGCLSHRFDALVTGPVHKGIINQSGLSFTGHTEFLAKFTSGYPVMMLATAGLRVALVTTHLPLAEASSQITAERLERVARTLYRDLQRYFDIAYPRILVSGLNPHAGEDGHLGSEESEIIEPVIAQLCDEGMELVGPISADTLFNPQQLETADAVLVMYHDQGLPVLKHLGFGHAVNITLGLPIIRTSVDHGTALELAGSGKAQIGSLETAVKTAFELVITSKRSGRT
ncbi:MAG: 4-hydroxythreonine-4-phosphate dehydrogenase PdxA [Gammaproteobacteria bacterium]|nr:4-hydroxythreonine-4-phosphate dehydrogenase PdxA [Gammaproteobacteria bacterium]